MGVVGLLIKVGSFWVLPAAWYKIEKKASLLRWWSYTPCGFPKTKIAIFGPVSNFVTISYITIWCAVKRALWLADFACDDVSVVGFAATCSLGEFPINGCLYKMLCV